MTEPVHVLHVRVGPDDPEARLFSVTCPHDRADLKRPCVAWWECMEHNTEATRERLVELGGEESCAAGEFGYHDSVQGMVAHPSRDCIVADHDSLMDNAHDLSLPVGDHPVDFDVEDWDEIRLITIPATDLSGGEG